MRKIATIAASVLTACVLALGITAATHAQQSTKTTAPATSAKKSTGTTATKSASTEPKNAPGPALTTDKEKQSYALGMNIARGISRQGADVDAAAMARGLRDTLSGAKPLLTDDEAEAELKQLQDVVKAKQDAELQKMGDANMKEGQEFLAANKTKDGVVALPSGLQYKIITPGTGPKPTADDTVVCNYSGTFLNGTEFDSSYKRGKPAEFPLKGVIKGWTEALQLMPVGSKWQLFIPSALAYGPQGRGPIPPNSTLIFQVELISIKGK
ncbi:MAG: FKBP-type peptidyl-prolyl cis-trans isomerase [Candidatus Acidiferrales bacterium]